MSNVTLQIEGRRIYISCNSFPIKDAIKEAGGHWDGDRRQWWIGAGKKEEIEKIVSASQPSTDSTGRKNEVASDETEIRAKAAYKGKTYFVICEARDGSSAKLTTLDGKTVFWAKRDNGMEIVKRYEEREERNGYGRGTGRFRYQSLGGIRRFIEGSKKTARGNIGFSGETKTCWECGRAFDYAAAKENHGDWQGSYCGC